MCIIAFNDSKRKYEGLGLSKEMRRIVKQNTALIQEIQKLKKEKDAVLFAHYYVADEIQEIADCIGDSYFLSQEATKVENKTIVVCGVTFMGESAKLLNPEKTVLVPSMEADCPMAHMVEIDKILDVRKQYEDVAVVCYINSTAEIKAHSDVCVTSANALKIVENLPNKNIFFIPDENLGRYVASKVKNKNFIFNDGYCHVHRDITVDEVMKAREEHPNCKVLMHPECTPPLLELADYIGSTSGIIRFASENEDQEFIIVTEEGILYELKKTCQAKTFYTVSKNQICPAMKQITLEKVKHILETNDNEIVLSNELMQQSNIPLEKMLLLAK